MTLSCQAQGADWRWPTVQISAASLARSPAQRSRVRADQSRCGSGRRTGSGSTFALEFARAESPLPRTAAPTAKPGQPIPNGIYKMSRFRPAPRLLARSNAAIDRPGTGGSGENGGAGMPRIATPPNAAGGRLPKTQCCLRLGSAIVFARRGISTCPSRVGAPTSNSLTTHRGQAGRQYWWQRPRRAH